MSNIKRRLQVILFAFLPQHKLSNYLKYHTLKNLFSPTCGILANKVIEESIKDGSFFRIKFKGNNKYLFFPNSLPVHSIYQAVSEQFYSWHWHFYQIPNTKVEKDDIVFDCGCAEGIFTFLTFKNAKFIYAFEPLPEYNQGLMMTFKDTGNVEIVNSALGEKVGTAFLQKQGIASYITDNETDQKVKIETIDSFCSKNNIQVNFIKADIEGYEMNLLRGAKKSIESFRPKIAITTYHVGSHAEEIVAFLKSIHPSYNIITKGIEERVGAPVMLHAW